MLARGCLTRSMPARSELPAGISQDSWQIVTHVARRRGTDGCGKSRSRTMAVEMPDLNDIFNAAIACVSDEGRQRYLDAACGGDTNVRARVEALLRAHS